MRSPLRQGLVERWRLAFVVVRKLRSSTNSGGGRGASHHAPSSPAPPNRRDSDTPMMPQLFDVLFPIIHVARFGLDVGRPAADTTIQQHQPPRAGAHNPSGSLIP
jgi:hypothetical protein